MGDALQKIESAAEEVVASNRWQRLPVAVRVVMALGALGVTVGGIVAGYRQSTLATPPETKADHAADIQRLDAKIDAISPKAFWDYYDQRYGKKGKH